MSHSIQPDSPQRHSHRRQAVRRQAQRHHWRFYKNRSDWSFIQNFARTPIRWRRETTVLGALTVLVGLLAFVVLPGWASVVREDTASTASLMRVPLSSSSNGTMASRAVRSSSPIICGVLNTAGITLIPTSVIAMRQSIAIEQGLKGFNAADIFLPTLIATFVSFCAGLIVVARLQRLSLLNAPMAVFFLGFGGLMAGLYAWLSGLPADEMARTIGLVGSLVIVGIIALFVAVGALLAAEYQRHAHEAGRDDLRGD